jgi:hypothetical protein
MGVPNRSPFRALVLTVSRPFAHNFTFVSRFWLTHNL